MVSDKYKDFYTGENRKKIHECFCRLVECFRSDDFNDLNEICTDDCIADFSTIGHVVGIDNLKNAFHWPGPNTSISKSTIWNFVARSDGDKGVQSAYVQSIRAIEDKKDLHPFLYGGEFSSTLIKVNGLWKFSHIRYDLCYEFGNNLFVYGHWKLMDYQKYNGHEPMINPELDNPWYAIPEDEEKQSDEEMVFELMSKYAYAFDHGDFTFLKTFTTDEFFINGSSTRKDASDIMGNGDFLGHREVSDFLRDKFHKEAKMMHSCRMKSIQIKGNKALALMPRSEEHRLKNKMLKRDNIHSMFSTALHFIYAIKNEDGQWKMYKYRIEPLAEQIPIEDNCICFDEYVLGDK